MFKVTHSKKDNDGTILGIGNNSDAWYFSKSDAIKKIQDKGGNSKSPFYVDVNGSRVEVHALPKDKPIYLKTVKDGKETNNLSSLPDC